MIDSKHLQANIPSSKFLELPQYFGWGLSAFDGIPPSGLTESDYILNDFSCSDVRLTLNSGDTTSIISVDILKNGITIFETPVSIDISGTTSVGATTQFLFTSSATTVTFTEDDKVDFIVSGATDCKGLKIKLIGNRIINIIDPIDPIQVISGLIVDLNDTTMFNASGTTATEGQEIYNWGNWVTTNGVTGASQTVATKYPLLQTVAGNREVKFDGTNDFLDFGTPTELNFQTGDSFTIVIQLGSNAVDGALYHKGSSSDRQIGIFYFGGWDIYTFNDQFAKSTDPVPNVVTHSQYDGGTRRLYSWLNNVIEHNNTAVTGNVVNNLPSLLGARHNNTGGTAWAFFYPGSLRRVLIWDRVLTTEERTTVYNQLSL